MDGSAFRNMDLSTPSAKATALGDAAAAWPARNRWAALTVEHTTDGETDAVAAARENAAAAAAPVSASPRRESRRASTPLG